jgi:hypothetical protein
MPTPAGRSKNSLPQTQIGLSTNTPAISQEMAFSVQLGLAVVAATRPIRTFRWLIQTATPLVRDKLGRRKSALQHHSLALSTFAGDVAQVGTGVHPTHQHHCAWLCIQSKPYRQLWRSTYSSVIHQPLRTSDPIPQLPPLLKVASFSRRAIRRKMHRAPPV